MFAPQYTGPLYAVARLGRSGPITELDRTRGEDTHRYPHFLPDGRQLCSSLEAHPQVAGMTR